MGLEVVGLADGDTVGLEVVGVWVGIEVVGLDEGDTVGFDVVGV